MNGPDRAMAYRMAAGTGFRASELRILTSANFDLDADPPTVTVGAAYSKRRRDDVQPIRPELAELLRSWLADKPAGKPVFPMPEKTAKMMRVDLKAAGISCCDSAGRVVDFHSLRHTYVSCIVDSGASVKVAQELARHSTPTLTVGRYAHTRFHDLTEALANVPVGDMSSEKVLAVGATGTDDAESGTGAAHAQRAGRETVRIPATRCDTGSSAHEVRQKDKPLCIAEDSETMRQDATQRENTLGRIRTCDLRIRSPLLYPTELRGQMTIPL